MPAWIFALLFLPGLHFWSVGIGKDAPMIMAITLLVLFDLGVLVAVVGFMRVSGFSSAAAGERNRENSARDPVCDWPHGVNSTGLKSRPVSC